MNFPFSKGRLKRAIERGLTNGKLDEELRELGKLSIKSRGDGEAICWGLEQLNANNRKSLRENARALTGLFQEVEGGDAPACEILREQGIPELCRIFEEMNQAKLAEDGDTLMFILKILAMYGTTEGTLKVVEAARQPLEPDGYTWSIILRNFRAKHPEKDLLFSSLRDPLPPEFIAVSLLDAANAILINGDSMAHPFDTTEGRERLRSWLLASDPAKFSYANSATAALPFISEPDQEALLELAMKHPDAGVRIEAAWAAAKVGKEIGLQRLAEHCRDFKTAERARRYLSELGCQDVIPAEANSPDFAALAEFAGWLAHPNELGEAPDELEIVDHRELRWPPGRELKPFWLIKYTRRDRTGLEDDDVECGLVGSMTFCLFSYKLAQRPPEDGYAVHCVWEMEHKKLIEKSVVEAGSKEYAALLQQWRGPSLEKPQMLYVAELSPELKYPQRLVGLASARVNGEGGWVVLDGERSEWCPETEQPGETDRVYASVILQIHVGRHLLGFNGKPDRKKYLKAASLPKSPEQIIAAYERILEEARNKQDKERKRAFGVRTPTGKHFQEYVDALVKIGRGAEVRGLIESLALEWGGMTVSGKAALATRHYDLAEKLFLEYRNKVDRYERGEEMGLLAEVWCRTGKHQAAQDLLIDCLQRLLAESKTATGSDKAFFEKLFQQKRSVFLKLYPMDGEAVLAERGVPASTLAA